MTKNTTFLSCDFQRTVFNAYVEDAKSIKMNPRLLHNASLPILKPSCRFAIANTRTRSEQRLHDNTRECFEGTTEIEQIVTLCSIRILCSICLR
jgi:hypothetical protein